jgi:hypothetical protein
MRKKPVKLLEIGVQNGGSLETWHEYFDNAQLLLGCDINAACAQLRFNDPKILLVLGDSSKRETKEKIISVSSSFDIVIDDGSHTSFDIINLFVNYFPLLSPGGIYVVEDTHTLYWSNWGGGIINELSAYAFFKRLVDIINLQFWAKEMRPETFLRTFFTPQDFPQFISEGWIESIEFRNSMIVVRKSLHPGHQKLGKREVGGVIAEIDPSPLKVQGLEL